MAVMPLRFRELAPGDYLFADEAGQFFRSNEAFLNRYARDQLRPADHSFLRANGHAYSDEDDFYYMSYLRRWAARQTHAGGLSYLILVPTLRCDLKCSYCQVSRVSERARGFDWDDKLLAQVLSFIDCIDSKKIKIEFQGGEPLLRLDLLQRVQDYCESHFDEAEFVVCTNLQHLDEDKLAFFENDNIYISTSLDGAHGTHEKNRTKNQAQTDEFFANLKLVIDRFGPAKVSALPTIDYHADLDLSELLDAYTEHGLRSIFLRPINYQGFARKKFAYVRDDATAWNAVYDRFLNLLIDYNFKNQTCVEEYYFSLCLRRVLRAGLDTHVDLRNPNPAGSDYLVIDYDGTLYPSDEARMITRTGQIDLSMGRVDQGLELRKRADLNLYALNNFHEDCTHCPYQAFCGTDLIDDLSRYGRIDLPKSETWFCQRHLAIFDKVFSLLYATDEKTRYSIAQWAGAPDPERGLGVSYYDTAAS